LAKSWQADVFIGPNVSTAMGAKRYSLPMVTLREAASSAAAPASRAVPVTYDSTRGHMTVTSQYKDLSHSHYYYYYYYYYEKERTAGLCSLYTVYNRRQIGMNFYR